MENNELEYDKIQKLFLKLCFIFKNINLDINLPQNSSETVQLLVPKELIEENNQIGSIQYGGVKYPLNHKSKENLRYVEIRLKGDFLKEIDVYDVVLDLMGQIDANGWAKYKFIYKNEDLKLARKVAAVIAKGFEKKFGYKYLTIGIDKNILELPRQRGNFAHTYNQNHAVKVMSDLLIEKGYKVSRSSEAKSTYHLMVMSNDKCVRILVKNLQYDGAYKDSSLPYQVYKIDAFETREEQAAAIKEIDLVVGYNVKDDRFACLDIKEFTDKRSRVVHEREGLKSEFYNSWHLLDNHLSVGK